MLADGDGVTTASEAEAYCKSSGINLKNRIHAREAHMSTYMWAQLYIYTAFSQTSCFLTTLRSPHDFAEEMINKTFPVNKPATCRMSSSWRSRKNWFARIYTVLALRSGAGQIGLCLGNEVDRGRAM